MLVNFKQIILLQIFNLLKKQCFSLVVRTIVCCIVRSHSIKKEKNNKFFSICFTDLKNTEVITSKTNTVKKKNCFCIVLIQFHCLHR